MREKVVMVVKKRDGREVEFDRGKIKNAIIKAYTDVYNSEIDNFIQEINEVTDEVILDIGKNKITVEKIQDLVLKELKNINDEHTAALDPKTTAFVLELTNKIVREQKLTTLMVTHSMRQALDYGDRTVMLHQGQVAFDVAGEQRKKMDVPDLLRLFEQSRHEKLSDDGLLLDS